MRANESMQQTARGTDNPPDHVPHEQEKGVPSRRAEVLPIDGYLKQKREGRLQERLQKTSVSRLRLLELTMM